MFSNWQVNIDHGVAYIYKRKYWLGLIAVPWHFSGPAYTILTQDVHNDLVDASLDYIIKKDIDATIQITMGSFNEQQ